MIRPPVLRPVTRRRFCALSALGLASLELSAPDAFAGEAAPETAAPIVIVHTNDVHCAIDENLGYAKLVNCVEAMRAQYGADNVALVDAGDAVQGKAIGTLTEGEDLIKIMNECGYDVAAPGNHEFDYGMAQFDKLIAEARAKYVCCNFTDLRTGSLRFDSYVMREYGSGAEKKKVAFVGICTPESLTKSSPAHFQDESGRFIYGFCEDDSGSKLYDAVQRAVDQARADGADYVVALAHLGEKGSTPRWSSTAVVQNTSGIDVVIDGHSHEIYAQTPLNKDGKKVLLTQTGTQLVGIGQVVIDPANNIITAFASDGGKAATASTDIGTASILEAWDGSDGRTAAFIDALKKELEKITGQVIGISDERLVAYEDDNFTWAVRAHETNLSDFVADAYLALAHRDGIKADIAFVNGGGIRSNVERGNVTYGDLINVHPFNNQLAYVDAQGQSILDALEMGAASLPDPSGGLQHVSGLTYTVRTDVPSSVKMSNGVFAGVTGEYRVRDVRVNGEALDVSRRYKLVSHTFLLVDGGDGFSMFKNDEATLFELDNQSLISYIQQDLQGTIGSAYADPAGQGRIVMRNSPDAVPTPEPTPDAKAGTGADGRHLAATGDRTAGSLAGAAAVAGAAGAAVVAGAAFARASR